MSQGTYQVKASTYKPFPIVNSLIEFDPDIKTDVVQELSDYFFKVTLPVPLEVLNPCYIKFVFPVDFGISEADLNYFEHEQSESSINRIKQKDRSSEITLFNDKTDFAARTLVFEGCTVKPDDYNIW